MKIKHLTLIALLLFIIIYGCSSAKSGYIQEMQESYQWPHLKQGKIHALVLDWLDNNFYTPKLTIESSDPEKGILMLKGLTTMNYMAREYPVAFKAKIKIRENKAEITYQDFEMWNPQDRKLLNDRQLFERLKPNLKRISHSLYRYLSGKIPSENEF